MPQTATTRILYPRMSIVVRLKNLALYPSQDGIKKEKEEEDAEKEVRCYLYLWI